MGPKSKLLKSSWGECKLCHCFLSPLDVSKHVDSCHGDGNLCNTSGSVLEGLKNQGFIRNNILHGFARERPSKGDELSKLPVFLATDVVLLHPSFMTLCQIPIGTLVMIWVSRHKFVFQTAWPAKDGGQVDVGLSSNTLDLLECSTGDLVHVQGRTDSDQRPATELVIEAKEQKEFYTEEDFANYFRHLFDGKLLTTGASLFINYLGQRCKLKINQINGTEESQQQQQQLTTSTTSNFPLYESEASSSFSELSITESPIAETLTSTPKRKSNTAIAICECRLQRPILTGSLFYVHSKTKVTFDKSESEQTKTELSRIKRVTFEDIGGLTKQIEEIKQLLFLPTEGNQFFSAYGLKPPRGILLFGVPGTGKTMIGRAVANIMKQNFILINGPELFSKFYGETEAKLRDIFTEAKMRAPCVIFIDEIDSLCPKRGSSSTQQEQRVVATLLTLLDSLPTGPEDRVVVLAATSKLDALDPAMRRPGRFDREIEIGIPTSSDRLDIVRKLLKKISHNLSNAEINEISSNTHGYVGADLEAMCSQAGLHALRRVSSQLSSSMSFQSASTSDGSAYFIAYSDMVLAAKEIKPSGLREVLIEIPKVHWEDIGGQRELKHKLKQAVEWPLKHPEVFQRMGIVPPKGILMYGPPGCSKTLIAKALATESGLNFIAIKGPEVFSKWVGESESAIREVFRKARAAAPSIIFFDEIDSLAAERGSSSGGSNVGDRVLAQLLSEMDGLATLTGVTIIASTNRPDMIDKALLRPGRLDRIVYVSLPDAQTRHDIFGIQFRTMPIGADVQIDRLVEKTEGYSGAEVVAVCREAALRAMEDSLEAKEVSVHHFLHALTVVRPRTTRELITFYETYGHPNSHIQEHEL